MSEDEGRKPDPPRRALLGGSMAAQPSPADKARPSSPPPAWLDAMPDEVNEAMVLWQR